MFISRTIRKILSLAPRKTDDLREACNALAGDLDRQLKSQPGAEETQDTDESKYVYDENSESAVLLLFRPFVLSCQSGNPRLVETALDCLQKLIQNNYVRGAVRSDLYEQTPNPKIKPHIDVLVNVVCSCFDSSTEDLVQLQIIKALLTAVSSPRCPVHDAALINAVRTCYNIHLVSRSIDNQKVAKAALTQITNTVLKRTEQEGVRQKTKQQSTPQPQEPESSGVGEDHDLDDLDGDGAKRSQWSPAFVPGKFTVFVDVPETSGVIAVKGSVALAGESSSEFDSAKQDNFRELIATVSGIHSDHIQITNITDAEEFAGVVMKFSVLTKGSELAGDVQIKLLEAVSDEGNTSHSTLISSTLSANSSAGVNGGHKTVAAPILLYQRDSFLLFRALCKISMRVTDSSTDSNAQSLEIKSKVLSLGLLLNMLKTAGPCFIAYTRITQSVRSNLINSLLRNVITTNTGMFSVSVDIFAVLISRFRHVLKTEIQVFFQNIFLRTLDSSHSSFEHKACILRAVKTLVSQPQVLVDLFLNYDCEMESVDLFEKLVTALSRTATCNHVTEMGFTSQQDAHLTNLALENVVEVLASLQNWIDNGEERGKGNGSSNVGTPRSTVSEDPATTTTVSQQDDDAVSNPNLNSNSNPNSSVNPNLNPASSGGEDDDAVVQDRTEARMDLHMSKEKKLEREKVIAKFNLGAKEALDILIDSGMIERTPDSIAHFLRTTPKLDSAMVGTYLGANKEFNIAVMHRFIEQFNFTNMEFDMALRKFLGGFRMPGEAQVVDRIMEKFGAVYCAQNPKQFRSSDTAFVLAFSLLMLNTDLHSPSIKNHMTKAQFLQNNRSINKTEDGEDCDMDPDYMCRLYDNISNSEIKLLSNMTGGTSSAGTSGSTATSSSDSAKQRQFLFAQETALMVKRSQELVTQTKQKHVDAFVTGIEIDHARLMFGISWCAVLAAFSLLLERSSDTPVIALTLKGFSHAIHIASRFFLDTERNAFVLSLSKFTCLHTLREMSSKSIEAIKTLLAISRVDGDFLQESWYEVIHSISQLQKLQLLGAGAHSDADVFEQQTSRTPVARPAIDTKATPTKSMGMGMGMMSIFSSRAPQEILKDEEKAVEEHNALSVGEHFTDASLDQIFSASDDLSNDAVVFFVKALCRVAREELDAPNPRIFCLQKIVETSYFNMDRSRLVWRRIWEAEGGLFTYAACHRNQKVAMYCIDSLRQLAGKFLEKDELENYQFQKEFLKPFELIMAKNGDNAIRELVLECMSNMVLSRSRNIKSGWKCVLNVCAFAATTNIPHIVTMGFQIVNSVFTDCFDLVHNFFVDGVNCLIAYGANQTNEEIALLAIQFVKKCAQDLGVRSGAGVGTGGVVGVAGVDHQEASDQAHIKVWFPMLTGLSRITSGDPRSSVRNAALTVLFESLHDHGHVFSSHMWVLTFRGVLFPIFDDVRYAVDVNEREKDSSWLHTTCLAALRALVVVFCAHYALLSFMLGEMLGLLTSCIMQVSESLSKIGFICLNDLCSKIGSQFTPEMWELVCRTLHELADLNTPFIVSTKTSVTDFSPNSTSASLGSLSLNDSPRSTGDGNNTTSSSNGNNGSNHGSSNNGHGGNGNAIGTKSAPRHRRQLSIEQFTASDAKQQQAKSTTTNSVGDDNATPNNKTNNNSTTNTSNTSPQPSEAKSPKSKGVSVNESGILQGEFDSVRCKCFVQLELVKVVGDICSQFQLTLPSSLLHSFLDLLHASYAYASAFNKDIAFRVALQRAGLLKSMPSQLPSLLKQEVTSLSTLLRLCKQLSLAQPKSEHTDMARHRLLTIAKHVLESYTVKETHVASIPMTDRDIVRTEQYRELVAWNEIVVDVIGVFDDALGEEMVSKHLGEFLPGLFGLIGCESVEVRECLRDFLVRRCSMTKGLLLPSRAAQ